MSLADASVESWPYPDPKVENGDVNEENAINLIQAEDDNDHGTEDVIEDDGAMGELLSSAGRARILCMFGFQPVEGSNLEQKPIFDDDDEVIVPSLGKAKYQVTARGFRPTQNLIGYLLYGLNQGGTAINSCHVIMEHDMLRPAALVGESFCLGYHNFDGVVESITVVDRSVDVDTYQYVVSSNKDEAFKTVSESFMVQMAELKFSMSRIRKRAIQRRAERRRLRGPRATGDQRRDTSIPPSG